MKANVGTMVRAAKCKTIDITTPITLEAYVEFIVRDKEGRITQYKRKKAESFVRQFIDLLYTRFAFNGEAYGILDITNTSRNVFGIDYYYFDVAGYAGVVNKGIIIGTGTGAVAIGNYVIGTIIPHATMNYGAVTFGAPADDGTTTQFRITRDFANVSGGSVTVEECGLYSIYAYTLLLARDLTGGIVVPNGQTLTVNYQIQGTIANYLVRGLIHLLYSLMAGSYAGAYDITGANRTVGPYKNTLCIDSPAGFCYSVMLGTSSPFYILTHTGDDFGVVVGSGTAAVASSDYKLATKIAHGKTSGTQLLHAGTEVDLPVVSAPTASVKVRRYFYNDSGATVTVKEAGIYASAFYSPDTYYLYLIARKLTGDVAVLNTELLKVEWTFQVST